ncbi:hypothetical protein IJV57_00310 [Candidatus Saccharibacteria bacterium]|nr:hypothetical protein [Candidatus Saccharibacteria bacterium]
MKRKKIKQLIDESGVLGFGYENGDCSVCWSVTPGEGMMLGKRTIEDGDGLVDEVLVAVPYAHVDLVDGLYADIVIDFVEFYYDDLCCNSATEWSLFDDIASPQDEGLLQMLSFFGKTYGEFLNDVFFWFGVANEVKEMIGEEYELEYSALNEDERLTKKVLDHLGEHYLYVMYDVTGEGAYWNFAKANGEIWFSNSEIECYDFGYMIYEPAYGHVKISDVDGMAALRDAVLTDFMHESWEMEDSGEALALLGIDQNDL